MPSRSLNSSLNKAKGARQDEFYTQLPDIEAELRHYRQHFRGKSVLCNCDDPFESNFFRYFALNFNRLGLKRLVATDDPRQALQPGGLPEMTRYRSQICVPVLPPPPCCQSSSLHRPRWNSVFRRIS